jgi:hypothetical protein
VIALELKFATQCIGDLEPRGRAEGHRKCNGSVQFDDR